MNAAYANATLLRYHRAWTRFAKFCQDFGLPSSLPVNHNNVALFIGYLSTQSIRASTIRSLLSAIAWQHKVRSLPDPTQSFLIPRLLEGIKRSQKLPPNRVSPIPLSLLHNILGVLPRIIPSAHDLAAFTALFLLSYYAALRAGEVVRSGGTPHFLLLKNVKIIPTILF